MEDNPPCACVTSTYYKCAWCPGSLAEEIKCHCQLHWILYPQLYGLGGQSGLGLGVCLRCVSGLDLSLWSASEVATISTLDTSTRVTRGQIEVCVNGAITQEVEVQGNLALSTSVDDRSGVRVWVQVGRARAPTTGLGRGDTTTVEYSVNPYDRDMQRYLDEGFRAVNRTFDWDRPDRYNGDPGTQVVSDGDLSDSGM